MATPIAAQVIRGTTLVSDGAWATLLHRWGLDAGECSYPWNTDQPENVRVAAAGYVQSGAHIIGGRCGITPEYINQIEPTICNRK